MKFFGKTLCLLALISPVHAADLRVLSSGAVKEAYVELVEQFTKTTGHTVETTWSSTVHIKDIIPSGAVYDLVIVGAPEIDQFIKTNHARAGSRADLAKVGVGVGMTSGMSADISTADGLKAAILNARKIACSTGPSGAYIPVLFEKLGVTAQVKDRLVQTKPGVPSAEYLRKGEVDLAFQQVSEFVHEGGITYLGPLPEAVQNYTNFSSAIPTTSAAPDAAKALQDFLAAPSTKAIKQKHGLVGGPF